MGKVIDFITKKILFESEAKSDSAHKHVGNIVTYSNSKPKKRRKNNLDTLLDFAESLDKELEEPKPEPISELGVGIVAKVQEITDAHDKAVVTGEVIRLLDSSIHFLELLRNKNNPEINGLLETLEFHLSYFQTIKDETKHKLMGDNK